VCLPVTDGIFPGFSGVVIDGLVFVFLIAAIFHMDGIRFILDINDGLVYTLIYAAFSHDSLKRFCSSLMIRRILSR
jgi:hypothetical protein